MRLRTQHKAIAYSWGTLAAADLSTMQTARSMTFLKTTLAVAAVTVLSAHVAPSVDDNNRYVKVTPLADGFRLAYTVFFGEIPGAAERPSIDTNRDSRIDDGEAKRFAD